MNDMDTQIFRLDSVQRLHLQSLVKDRIKFIGKILKVLRKDNAFSNCIKYYISELKFYSKIYKKLMVVK